MIKHIVKVYPSKKNLPKKKQLAWKIAEIASDNAKLNKSIMIGDSETDSESARAAGLPFILVEDGYTDKTINEINHNHLIKDFNGIEQIINKYLIN